MYTAINSPPTIPGVFRNPVLRTFATVVGTTSQMGRFSMLYIRTRVADRYAMGVRFGTNLGSGNIRVNDYRVTHVSKVFNSFRDMFTDYWKPESRAS